MSYQEKLKIYEQLKNELYQMNLSQSEYERKIKQLAEYLEI